MTDIMIDIEMSFPQGEFLKLKELSEQLGISIPETAYRCMFEKRDEYLDMFKNNIPEEEKQKDETTRLTPETPEGLGEGDVSDEVSQNGLLQEST